MRLCDFFENLIEPDSPPQYHGWFNEIPLSTASVPPYSQYKVFYHIFAGSDRGAYFSVYLRSPEGTSLFQGSSTVNVASGYITKGDFVTETRDFSDQTGFKELCINVNGQEECGFKQSSTSFGVDYLKDLYAKEQAGEVDIDSESSFGLATVKIIRAEYPFLPCILLTSKVNQEVLGKALELNACHAWAYYNRGCAWRSKGE